MLFDTDILIWMQRGNRKAAELIDQTPARCISIITSMELLQEAQKQLHHRIIKDFLQKLKFDVLPLSENIGHRALVYVEEYALSSGLTAADAIIAATAAESGMPLCTSNQKNFKPIQELELRIFKPGQGIAKG